VLVQGVGYLVWLMLQVFRGVSIQLDCGYVMNREAGPRRSGARVPQRLRSSVSLQLDYKHVIWSVCDLHVVRATQGTPARDEDETHARRPYQVVICQ